MRIMTEADVRAACDEAHDARGYTEANALAAILERMILAKQRDQSEPVAYMYGTALLWPDDAPIGEPDCEPLCRYPSPQPLPEGMVMVPREPTEVMHTAACKVLLRAHGLDELPKRMLHAMIAAAEKEAKPCKTCNGEGGWEAAASSTSYFWKDCPDCKAAESKK